MAETKTFNTRLRIKADTYANWLTVKDTFIPLENELCAVIVPAEAGAVVQEPAVLFKLGDGKTNFGALNFTSSISADVYDWAKAKAKPTYTASEITGLADYIAGKVEDTDTQYKIEQDTADEHTLKFYSKSKGEEWTLVTTITTPDTNTVYDDSALTGRVSNLETLMGSDSVATQISAAITALNLAATYEKKGAAQEAVNAYKTENDAAVAAAKKSGNDAQADVNILKGDDAGKSARAIAAEEVAKIVEGADASFDTLKEISDWISSHGTTAAEMNSAILELQTEVTKKANDADLAAIAKSGNVNDIIQTDDDYIVFYCGSATEVI